METVNRFRWSDGHSRAVEFDSTVRDFPTLSIVALRKFQAGAKRFHDGSDGVDKIYFTQAQLHLKASRAWRPVSLKPDSVMVVYGKTYAISNEQDYYDAVEMELFFKSNETENAVNKVYNKEARLEAFLGNLSDMINRETRRTERYGKLKRGWDWRTTENRLNRADSHRKQLGLSKTEYLEKAIDNFLRLPDG